MELELSYKEGAKMGAIDTTRDLVLEFHAKRDQPSLTALLDQPDATERLLAGLPAAFPPDQIESIPAQETWQHLAHVTSTAKSAHDGLALFRALYEQMIRRELDIGSRLHKGMPLVWMSECHAQLGRPCLAKRFLMLTLVEDAIQDRGVIDPTRGVYFRAVWKYGMSATEVQRYAGEVLAAEASDSEAARFPEWVLQQLDDRWLVEYPSSQEGHVYFANSLYIDWLVARCGDMPGSNLETLARYVVSVMPGCRARKERSHSTDYDIMCCIEGPQEDFRSEFGRYFVCECKDWADAADFSAFAKFCRVLDSVKCRFGVLFSRHGVTGATRTTDAAREQVKVFQDRGMVIVVVSRRDLEELATGSNFIALLRAKYEAVRMDLRTMTSSVEARSRGSVTPPQR
jgi:hypothetical protein